VTWSPPAGERQQHAGRWRAALVVLAIAAAVRLWGIGFGLPYDLTADEPHHIIQALKVGAGSGGPLVRMWHTVGKGGLDYVLFAEYGVLYAVWWLLGRVHGTRDFALAYLQDPTAFYLVGRVTIAALGALTCVWVFGLARRMYDERVALGAALLGALAYYHVAESHVINVHIAMACALWASLFVYSSFEARPRLWRLIVAGILCGTAIALAYTAGLGLLMMAGALWSLGGRTNVEKLRLTAVLFVAALIPIVFMSPELLSGAGLLLQNFTGHTPAALAPGTPESSADVRSAIDSVTIIGSVDWTAYLLILLKPYNVLLTLAAVVGAVDGIRNHGRWPIVLTAGTVFFVLVVSASQRGQSERYLFPIAPALWILGSRGIEVLAAGHRIARRAGLAAVAVIPLVFIVRDDYTLSKPDTRVLAKQWIEANVPAGSRILMDGMRFRFVQSPPLTPDRQTIERRLTSLEQSELSVPRDMLPLYRAAAEHMPGPKYDLRSTVYGLEVEELDYYVRECYDYIVVSSFHEKRYASDGERRRYPRSAQFYEHIKSDPRFRVVYSVRPASWQHAGPELTVYRVVRTSNAAARDQRSEHGSRAYVRVKTT
jgi:hypothetical protein